MRICFSVAGGPAFACALDVVANLWAYYTDSGMATLNPLPELKVALLATPIAEQVLIMRECQDAAQSKPYAEFCANVNALAGMK